ncbi:MAG: tRNA pseudouridine(55) synthase TruB [Bacteroidales bacterium]|nr:tRNA pseudouridine(55) synthase TruB [Bacteroidales bacterium]
MNPRAGEIIYIDKPYRWTSFDVVNKIRWLLCRRLNTKKLKVGHAGTLDPLATGVMIVCTGRCTKRIDELQAHTKEYVATLRLGATTPSFDLEHEIDAYYPTAHISREQIEEVLKQFIGRIEQVPPSYSAVKIDGKRAYDLARRDKEPELKAKILVIDEIELLDCHLTPADDTMVDERASDATFVENAPVLPRTGMRNKAFLTSPTVPADRTDYSYITIRVVCSKGTYIRALARDIGFALGSGAHLTALRRTRVGKVSVDDCLSMDTFAEWLEKQDIITDEQS